MCSFSLEIHLRRKGPRTHSRRGLAIRSDKNRVIEVPGHKVEEVVSDLQFTRTILWQWHLSTAEVKVRIQRRITSALQRAVRSSFLVHVEWSSMNVDLDELNVCSSASSSRTNFIPDLWEPVWDRGHAALGSSTQTQRRDHRIPAATPREWVKRPDL